MALSVLSLVQKTGQFIAPDQEGPPAPIGPQTSFEPTQHGVLVDAEQRRGFLHRIGPCSLDPANVVAPFFSGRRLKRAQHRTKTVTAAISAPALVPVPP